MAAQRQAAFPAACVLCAWALAGCGQAGGGDPALLGAPENAVYYGVDIRMLETDMVNLIVTMEGARGPGDVLAYARCAAAQYTLVREAGFARHLRTNVARRGRIWQADAVYTVSPALPRGLRTIDAEVTVADCIEQGIPTV